MADTQNQNQWPAAFGTLKAFENGGYVIQWSMSLNDILKLGVRNNKVYFRLTELKEPTKYGAKYLIREDEYMANYQNGREGSFEEIVFGDGKDKTIESVEREAPYKPGEITANAGKPVGPQPAQPAAQPQPGPQAAQPAQPAPAPQGPMAQNVDDLFA